MFIIYGRRGYGRVHEWGSEWAQTSFAHLWFMPLFPLRTIWVRERADGSTVAIPARLSGQSVAVAYLRMWGPIAAIACGAAIGGYLGAAIAVSVLALCGLAWMSRSIRLPSARRRSDFNLLAFGTRCDPVLMTDEIRATAQLHLEARHRGVAVPRPPDDVARFGPVDLDEAVIAYGLLRLGALAHAGGAESDAVARLLAASHEPLEVGDGPYRERDVAPASDALHAQVQAAAAVVSERVRAAPLTGKRPSVWRRNARIGFGLSAIVAVGALLDGGAALLPTRTVTAADLAHDAPNGRFVEVTCDDVSSIGMIVSNAGKMLYSTYSCALGDRHLVLLTAPDATSSPANHVFGKLGDFGDNDKHLPPDLETDPGTLPSFLDVRSRGSDLAGAIVGLVCSFIALGFVAFWLRARLRARRATRA